MRREGQLHGCSANWPMTLSARLPAGVQVQLISS
jgi:hypothetical protein